MSPQDKLQQFLEELDPKILERGKEYFYSGQVACLEWNETCVSAEVSGGEAEPYQVEIDFSETGEVEDWYCDCPYDWGPVCKHTAAVLLAVLEGEEEQKKHDKKTGSDTLRNLVEQAEKTQLVRLILDYCDKDTRFQNQVLSELEDTGEQMFAGIQRKIQASIFNNTDGNYINWEGCDKICSDLDEALEQIDHRIQQGQYGRTLDILLYILLTGMDLLGSTDDGFYALFDTVNVTLETIGSAISGLTERGDERKAWVQKLLDAAQSTVFDDWDDWRYSLLQNAALLADAKSEKDIYAVLDHLSDKRWESFKDDPYSAHMEKRIRYQVLCTVHGEAEARAYLENNLDVDEFRLTLVRESMEKGDYARAEALCREQAEEEPSGVRGMLSQWQYLLYDIYRDWGKRDKQVQQARMLARSGDRKFYQVTKTLMMEDGCWEQEHLKLLTALKEKLPAYSYMDLLAKEGEADLLMEQLRLSPGSVFQYGAVLAPQYGEEVFHLCSAMIRRESENVGNRKEYQNLCAMIDSLAGFGAAAEARKLIGELRQRYPRRPALIDELGKIECEISKIKG